MFMWIEDGIFGITVFYSLSCLLFFLLFYWKTNSIRNSLMVALLFIMVGSEYWELPIFMAAALGLFNHTFSDTLHPLMALIWFVILIISAKIEFSSRTIILLFMAPIVNTFLLLPFTTWSMGFVCRGIAMFCLGASVYYGSSLVRVESKPI